MIKIKEISKEIARLENEISKGNNVQENEEKMEEIISHLSLEEIFMLDDYIIENELIK